MLLFFPIFLAVIYLVLTFLSVAGFYLIIRSIIHGAPFVPTKKETVKKMIELLCIVPGEKAVDLGSGDGRLVIALARVGAEAHGYEFNPFLVWFSRFRIRREGLEGKAFVHRQSFWKADCKKFSAVSVFGISYIMPELEKKLREELPFGARVVSNTFPFPSWVPARREGSVFLYKKE